MSAGNAEKTPAKPQVLLSHHLKQLKLPTFLAEYADSPANVPVKVSIIPATCSGLPSWSSSSASAAWWNGVSGRHASRS
jgi:hypothetical protein